MRLPTIAQGRPCRNPPPPTAPRAQHLDTKRLPEQQPRGMGGRWVGVAVAALWLAWLASPAAAAKLALKATTVHGISRRQVRAWALTGRHNSSSRGRAWRSAACWLQSSPWGSLQLTWRS